MVGTGKLAHDKYRIFALDSALIEVTEDNWECVLLKGAKVIMMAACSVEKSGICPSCGVLLGNSKLSVLNR